MSKKLIQINTVCNSSSGHIMGMIQKKAVSDGFETLSIYGRRKGFADLPCCKVGNVLSFWLHVILTTVTDLNGLGSVAVTRKMIKKLREEKPDIIHLHNIHGYYLNYPILFKFLKNEYKGAVVWTLHDCWAYTGHCAFYAADCDRWKSGCYCCPHKDEYPISWFLDNSKFNWHKKKKCFLGLGNMTIVVPSEWMYKNVRESLLSQYPIEVIHNGIDLSEFRQVAADRQNLYGKYGIGIKEKIILDVAGMWNDRKGLPDLKEIAGLLDGTDYRLVLVGLDAMQAKSIPSNVICIARTSSESELCELYSAACVFVNPSLEESFSMVTLEALACGTPAIVLDTSAVKELITDSVGIVLQRHEGRDYIKAIGEIEAKTASGAINKDSLRARAMEFSKNKQIDGYISLYNRMTSTS